MTSALDLCESITLFLWIKSIYVVLSEQNNPSEREKILNKAFIEKIQWKTVRILVEWKKDISCQDKSDEDPNQNG